MNSPRGERQWPPMDGVSLPKPITIRDLDNLAANNPVVHSAVRIVEMAHDREQGLICALGYLAAQYAAMYDTCMAYERTRLDERHISLGPA